MAYTPISYQPGTAKTPQQSKISSAAFVETDKVHFPHGKLSAIPEWSEISPSNMDILGGARALHGATLTGTYVGNYYLIGTNLKNYVKKGSELYNMTPLKTSGTTLGTDPLAITSGDKTVVVTHATHGFSDGDRIAMSGISGTLNGVPAADFNREHIITYISAGSYSIEVATEPTSTDLTAGGAAVVVKGQIDSGALHQSAATGYGLGLFGEGLFGSGGAAVTAVSFPRIWTYDSFGNEIVMCPGDYVTGDGQNIYIWDGDTEVAPTVLTNAPTDCNFVLVVNNAVVALCGNTIKISELGDGTSWTPSSTSTAYEKTLERVDRLYSGVRFGDKAAVIFHAQGAVLLQYVGGGDLWDIKDLWEGDGIISPYACINMNGVVYWMGWRGWYRYAGGYPEKIPNIQNENWWFAALNYAQSHKCFAMPDSTNQQVYFFAPHGADYDCGNYVILNMQNPQSPTWTLGELDRTASMRGAWVDARFLAVNGTSESVAGNLYQHFVDNPDLNIGWSARTSFAYYGDGSNRFRVTDFMPDSYQGGDVSVKYITKEYAQQAVETESEVYTVTSATPHATVKAAGRVRAVEFSGNKAFTMHAWSESFTVQGAKTNAA